MAMLYRDSADPGLPLLALRQRRFHAANAGHPNPGAEAQERPGRSDFLFWVILELLFQKSSKSFQISVICCQSSLQHIPSFNASNKLVSECHIHRTYIDCIALILHASIHPSMHASVYTIHTSIHPSSQSSIQPSMACMYLQTLDIPYVHYIEIQYIYILRFVRIDYHTFPYITIHHNTVQFTPGRECRPKVYHVTNS